MADRLEEYRRKRDAARTPEPVPRRPPRRGRRAGEARFVIQQHHARALHWDLRLERDGVLVSWAVPRGLPRDTGRNHLAVRTEDHPMEYLDFHGEIPAGEYGGGTMTIHDRGAYRCEKWQDDEVVVVLDGERTRGRYVLFAAGGRDGRDWMVRRTDPPPPGWTPMPELVRPMHPTPAGRLPRDADAWGYELCWDGVRAMAYVSGGRLRLRSETDEDVTGTYPWLRGMAEALAPTEAVLDGVLVRIDGAGRVRRPSGRDGQFLIFDLLWLEGVASTDVPYAQRRELLDGLAPAGTHWQTPPWFPGTGAEALDTARAQRLPGVVAKRLDSVYEPGRRSRRWLSIGTG
ncbi:DNA polymerase ligase N-terminal domain-containing protein [Micromonospora halophytica]|uniref:Bifunctional non-homologous end joining protein LigD n=1 Tax=Micromonospora halophytica TaxID=47864 RepID=A0A1C5HCR3_9ACTN|nr:DNA polymerase ligase N-terminal domain-containing protein [Micromonospora halophytica]SCG43723.1 bifunctional non-homologous end joining protein LigD [Micromonospora halophytica]